MNTITYEVPHISCGQAIRAAICDAGNEAVSQ